MPSKSWQACTGMLVPVSKRRGIGHSQPAVSKDLFELMNQIARHYESNRQNAPRRWSI